MYLTFQPFTTFDTCNVLPILAIGNYEEGWSLSIGWMWWGIELSLVAAE